MSSQPEGQQPPPPARQTKVAKFLDTYFRTAPTHSLKAVDRSLWSGDGTAEWNTRNETYHTTVLEQYKIYVEMADRVSARRGTTNTFFLTLNTVIATAIGMFWKDPPQASQWLLLAPWLTLLGQCLAWFWLLRSYRQLNTAKYAVVGALEKRLPASPYGSAEWSALGSGRNPARYWPLSHVESWIPAFFAVAYTAGFIALLVS